MIWNKNKEADYEGTRARTSCGYKNPFQKGLTLVSTGQQKKCCDISFSSSSFCEYL